MRRPLLAEDAAHPGFEPIGPSHLVQLSPCAHQRHVARLLGPDHGGREPIQRGEVRLDQLLECSHVAPHSPLDEWLHPPMPSVGWDAVEAGHAQRRYTSLQLGWLVHRVSHRSSDTGGR